MPRTLSASLARRPARRFAPALAGPALAFALAGAAGCGSTTDPRPATTLPYTAGGTLRNVSGATVPGDARVVLVWAGDLVPAGDVAEGRVTDPAAFSRALGAAGQHAVIYVEGALPSTVNWTNMRQGYNVGRGVAATAGQTFDGFEAVGAGAIDLVVDALRNIKFVNWT